MAYLQNTFRRFSIFLFSATLIFTFLHARAKAQSQPAPSSELSITHQQVGKEMSNGWFSGTFGANAYSIAFPGKFTEAEQSISKGSCIYRYIAFYRSPMAEYAAEYFKCSNLDISANGKTVLNADIPKLLERKILYQDATSMYISYSHQTDFGPAYAKVFINTSGQVNLLVRPLAPSGTDLGNADRFFSSFAEVGKSSALKSELAEIKINVLKNLIHHHYEKCEYNLALENVDDAISQGFNDQKIVEWQGRFKRERDQLDMLVKKIEQATQNSDYDRAIQYLKEAENVCAKYAPILQAADRLTKSMEAFLVSKKNAKKATEKFECICINTVNLDVAKEFEVEAVSESRATESIQRDECGTGYTAICCGGKGCMEKALRDLIGDD